MTTPLKKKHAAPINELVDLQKTLDVSDHELAVLLETTPRTLYRWEEDQIPVDYGPFKRLREAVDLACASLRKEALAEWFREPNRALGGSIPIRLLADPRGYTLVMQLLGQAAYGLPL